VIRRLPEIRGKERHSYGMIFQGRRNDCPECFTVTLKFLSSRARKLCRRQVEQHFCSMSNKAIIAKDYKKEEADDGDN